MIAGAIATAVACGSGGGFIDAPKPEPPPPPGSFALDWTITKAGSAATCADVNATQVVVTLQDEKTKQSSNATFNCAIGGAVSGAIDPATYDMGFALVGSGGGSAIVNGAPQMGIVVDSAQTAHVMPVTFAVP